MLNKHADVIPQADNVLLDEGRATTYSVQLDFNSRRVLGPECAICDCASHTCSPGCKSWLTFWLISVGTGGSISRVPSGSGGSTGPFWDHFVEVVPPISVFAFLVVIGVCDVFSGLVTVSCSLLTSCSCFRGQRSTSWHRSAIFDFVPKWKVQIQIVFC